MRISDLTIKKRIEKVVEDSKKDHEAAAARLEGAKKKAANSTTRYKLHRAAAKHRAIAREKGK